MQQQSKATIAAVITNPTLAERLTQIVTKAGYEIKVHTSFRHIDTKLSADKDIDLLILPLSERGAADLELLAQIRRNPRLRYLPVIMLCEVCHQERVVVAKGQGASAIVTLPLSEFILLSRIETCLQNGKRVILLVDDEPTILDVLRLSLELERFKVLTAASAEEALDILGRSTVHAIVSDILLPKMNGMDLLVTSKERWPAIPVLLMTGCSGRFSPADAIAAGADGFFAKPFKNVQMVRVLREVIERAGLNPNSRPATSDANGQTCS